MEIPHKISAREAVRIIAGRVPSESGTWLRYLSKAEMHALARAACKTEGIVWESVTKKAEHGV